MNLTFFKKNCPIKNWLLWVILLYALPSLQAQIDNDGCVAAGFGIDADVYTDLLHFGDQGGAAAAGIYDWFTNGAGTQGLIDETNTAAIQALIDAGEAIIITVDVIFNCALI